MKRLAPKTKRLFYILALLTVMGCGVGVLLWNMRSHLEFFFTPTQLAQNGVSAQQVVRVGGLVVAGSVVRADDELAFSLTDGQTVIAVSYRGLPPALFREGQGMVARGKRSAEGVFIADELLARHDERYMPPEVARALKEQGHWRENVSMPTAEEPAQ